MNAKINEQNFKEKQDICIVLKHPKKFINIYGGFKNVHFSNTLPSMKWSLLPLALSGAVCT